jgi:ATP-dependent DNA helicase RecG
MNLADILSRGESEIVEFKASFNDEALETIGAFANAAGGALFIGVEPTGATCGVSVGRKTLEDWANRIQDATDPRLQPSMTREEHNGKTIVVIRVEPAAAGPVSVRGRFFRRVGRTNQRMSHEEIVQRLLSASGASWDASAEPQATWEDLDKAAIRKYVATIRQTGRRPIPARTSGREFLQKLDLLIGEKPTRAALLLFGKTPTRFYPSAFVKLGRFRTPTVILDDREVLGTLPNQIEETLAWLRERLQTRFEITGRARREVVWEYPLEALREAVINAVCHRDYLGGANIQVRLYDDRLEIWNPGGLPATLKPADLLRDHDSIPRNPKIASAFFFAGLIEQWGTGTLRMATALRQAGFPDPEFDAGTVGRFRVIVRQDPFTETFLRGLGLSNRQLQAVAFIRQHGEITNRDYRELANLSDEAARKEIQQLRDRGILEAVGKGRSTAYVLRRRASD